MRGVLARGRDAVVTGATGSEDLGMVDCCDWLKCDGAVAVFTNIRRLHVRRTLARSGGPVVAAHTVADDACMIEYGGRPSGDRVTVVALIIG